jgi:carboxylesterase
MKGSTFKKARILMDSPPQDVAVLLVHGLNGLRYDFDDVAAHLRTQGYAAEQVLLPGHEVHARVAINYGWQDWTQAVAEHFNDMAGRYRRVVVVGHSMGGALALHLAARDHRVAAVATLCAPAMLHPGLFPLVRFARYLMPFMPILREDISDPRERRMYRSRKVSQWVSVAPMHTLLAVLPALRDDLAHVCCPTLVMGARNDHVVPLRDAAIIYYGIASRRKKIIVLNRSWHVVTRDVERHIVTDHLVNFLATMRDADHTNEQIVV